MVKWQFILHSNSFSEDGIDNSAADKAVLSGDARLAGVRQLRSRPHHLPAARVSPSHGNVAHSLSLLDPKWCCIYLDIGFYWFVYVFENFYP